MNKYGIILISAFAGGLAYHLFLKKKGAFENTGKEDNYQIVREENRMALHKYLDKLTDGEVDEKEIEDKVIKIIQ